MNESLRNFCVHLREDEQKIPFQAEGKSAKK